MKPFILAVLFGVLSANQVLASPTKEILADGNGLTAYTFDPDQGTTSTCYNGCAKEWPPILLPAGETVTAPLGTTTRKDGTTQITYDGHPIYLYADDKKSGDVNGDGEDGVWHIVQVSE
jgi:predicted lipoprotein with Yx(FWY)xxD motif